jgi:hypothetical protein
MQAFGRNPKAQHHNRIERKRRNKMAQPNAIIVLDNPQPKELVPLTNAGRLVRRTVLDLSEHEFSRLQLMAKMYAASGYNKTKQTEGDFFLVMLKGMELGITPMASIDTINIIMGKPVLDAKGMLALVKSSGLLQDIHIEAGDTLCKVTIQRVGNVAQEVSFSFDDAKKMGLSGKDGWQKQPKTMLKWRAVTAAIREVFPDVISGLYTPEELDTDNTVVHDDGTMELNIPAKAQPQLEAPKRDINNVDEMIFGNEQPAEIRWIESLKNLVAPMYKNEFHLNNGVTAALDSGEIDTSKSIDSAASALLKHRMISEWGYEDSEIGLAIHESLGMTLKEYLAANPRDYASAWEKIAAFSNS